MAVVSEFMWSVKISSLYHHPPHVIIQKSTEPRVSHSGEIEWRAFGVMGESFFTFIHEVFYED